MPFKKKSDTDSVYLGYTQNKHLIDFIHYKVYHCL